LAILTLTVIDLSLMAWFRGDFEECTKAADHVFALFTDVLNEPIEARAAGAVPLHGKKQAGDKAPRAVPAR
jgi:hypothetical protein